MQNKTFFLGNTICDVLGIDFVIGNL